MAFSNHDVVPDSPINNFAVINLLAGSGTLSDGNLKSATGLVYNHSSIFLPKSEGAYYVEFYIESMGYPIMGIWNHNDSTYCGYYSTNQPNESIKIKSVDQSNEFQISNNNIVGCFVDVTGGTIQWFKNGGESSTSVYNVSDLSSCDYSFVFFHASGAGTSTVKLNFGQDPSFGGATNLPAGAGAFTPDNQIGSFAFLPVDSSGNPITDFKALCTANLPEGPIKLSQDQTPSDHFKAVTWTNATTDTNVTVNLPFQADMIWWKQRDQGNGHRLIDSVRGLTSELTTNSNIQEAIIDPATRDYNVTSINSDNFTFNGYVNTGTRGGSMVGWCWKAAGSPDPNQAKIINEDGSAMDATAAEAIRTSGSIVPSKISANRQNGFSITAYSGNGSAGATVPHGLSSAPDFVIVKQYNTSGWQWMCYHSSLGATTGLALQRSHGSSSFNGPSLWNNTEPTNNVVTLGAHGGDTNNTGGDKIMYCWHSVKNYSKCGSYVANGSPDGPYVELGFRPAWVMIKKYEGGTDRSWLILDSTRDDHNPCDSRLFPNTAVAEFGSEYNSIDILSNGFRPISASYEANESSGHKYIFMAFAEQPFSGPSNAR